MTSHRIADAFEQETFRELGHAIVDLVADSIDEAKSKRVTVRADQSPTDAFAHWSKVLDSDCDFASIAKSTIQQSIQTHHPHNLGHQVGPVLPAIAAMDLVGSILDTGNGTYDVGNPATPMERVVVRELTERFGLPESSDGLLTSGGSLGNLTAMLAMRQCKGRSWGSGSGGREAVMVSAEAHYCVDRAAKIMGWGDAGVIKVPVDDSYRMDLTQLQLAYDQSKRDGLNVLGVVGSAGSTATGQIDRLGQLADFSQRHGLWFHVDAAHAGAFVFSRKAKSLLTGIERADSIVIDFHKMLLSSSLLTAVLFQRSEDSYQTFAQEAGYLWPHEEEREWWHAAMRTLECTRPMLGLRAFSMLKVGREGLFESYIDNAIEVTSEFADLMEQAEDFELLVRPETNIICYRFAPSGLTQAELNRLNARLRARLLEEGKFFIVQVEQDGKLFLRSALMNPYVSRSVVEELICHLRDVARTIGR